MNNDWQEMVSPYGAARSAVLSRWYADTASGTGDYRRALQGIEDFLDLAFEASTWVFILFRL